MHDLQVPERPVALTVQEVPQIVLAIKQPIVLLTEILTEAEQLAHAAEPIIRVKAEQGHHSRAKPVRRFSNDLPVNLQVAITRALPTIIVHQGHLLRLHITGRKIAENQVLHIPDHLLLKDLLLIANLYNGQVPAQVQVPVLPG